MDEIRLESSEPINDESIWKTKVRNFWAQNCKIKDSIYSIIIYVFSIILSIGQLLYTWNFVDNSLNSKLVRLISMFIILLIQCIFLGKNPGINKYSKYQDYFMMIAMTYLSVICNILDIKQKVPNDLMTSESICFLILFSQCSGLAVVVGLSDRENVRNINQRKKLNNLYGNLENKEYQKCISKKGAAQDERNLGKSKNKDSKYKSIFQRYYDRLGSIKNLFKGNNNSNGKDVPMSTFRTIVDVHSVEENKHAPHFHDLTLQEETLATQNTKNINGTKSKFAEDLSISKINVKDSIDTHYAESDTRFSNPEDNSTGIKKDTTIEENRVGKIMVLPHTGARSKNVTRTLSNSKINEDSIHQSCDELGKLDILLSDEDAQPSNYVEFNPDSLGSLTEGAETLLKQEENPNFDSKISDEHNIYIDKMSTTESPSKPLSPRDSNYSPNKNRTDSSETNLHDSDKNQLQNRNIVKKVTFNIPLEHRVPSPFVLDPNLPENFFKELGADPAEISSENAITIYKNVEQGSEIFSSFKTREKVVYNL